jgi:hypothetical protein
MHWGSNAIILLIIIILLGITIYINNKKTNTNINTTEHFLALDETKLYNNISNILNPSITSNLNDNKPVSIESQIPVPVNQLSLTELQSIDSDVLRNVRTLKNFSMTDELNFYQMYGLLKKIKNQEYIFDYVPISNDKKSSILDSEKLIAINSGAINNTNLELFTRLKLELISAFNNLIIKNDFYTPYHPYQFFKIIKSNMISNKIIDNKSIQIPSSSSSPSSSPSYNLVFTITIAREYKYQQFVIYYDIDLISNSNILDTTSQSTSKNTINYSAKLNKVELIGIPIPNTIEFHPNQKTTKVGEDKTQDTNANADETKDFYYQDQVSDSAVFDVVPSSDPSIRNKSPNIKYIDIMETSDMDSTMFNENSLSTKMEDRIMNVARDQQFNNHRCYGLVDGVSQELPQYKNPIFCKSFHPEINQNGIWDAPCQVNSDCPFYKANKNYSNEFGKCDKITGQCEMPLGVTPIGYTKIGKIEPNCYNCGANSLDSKCCESQYNSIKDGKVKYKSPDYVFAGDESSRRQFENDIKSVGLLVNPSI